MSASNNFENELLAHVFTNADIAGIGDAGGLQNSASAGSLYISLHTADPGEAGTQASNEASYGAYARVAVARSGSGWTVSGNSVTNAAAVTFPTATGTGTQTATYFGIGTASTGAGDLLFSGALTSSLAVAVSNTPTFAIGQMSVTAD